jgi:cell shape-determining protein MreC
LKTRENSRYKFGRFTKTAVISIVVAFVVLIFAKGFVASITSVVIMPLYIVRNYIETSLDTIPTYIRGRAELETHIESLKQEIASQQGIKTTLSSVEEENKELRALIGATKTPTILASVIARPPMSPYDTVVIDKGTEDGVLSGAPVYYGSGQALGYVRVTYAHHALITLFSSSNVQSTVYIYGPNIFTTAYGEGGGVIRLSIPPGIVVESGNVVVLPSLDAGVLGEIGVVQSIPTEPEQHAYITSEVSLQSLRFVRVGTNVLPKMTFEDAVRVVGEVEKTLFSISVPQEYQAIIQSTTTDEFLSTTTPTVQ